MFLTFEFAKTFKFNLTPCCVGLKISAYTFQFFMMEKKNKKLFLAKKEKLTKLSIKYKEEYDIEESMRW